MRAPAVTRNFSEPRHQLTRLLLIVALAMTASACGGGGGGDKSAPEKSAGRWDEMQWDAGRWQ